MAITDRRRTWTGPTDLWDACTRAAEREPFAAVAWVEPPEGWARMRLVMTSLTRMGYEVSEWRGTEGVRLLLG